jgi:hypothetical protein
MYDSKLVNRLESYEMATKIEDRIKEASEKLAKLKAAKRKKEADVKAAGSKAARALDARKKTLIGVAVLEGLKTGKVHQTFMNQVLEAGLARNSDRAVFGLPAKT